MLDMNQTFNILLCGKKELMERVRKIIAPSDDVHLQFTSSPKFLLGRVMFTLPHVILIDAAFDRTLLNEVVKTLRSKYNHIHVFPIAASVNHHDVVEFMNQGASGYYAFPDDYRKLSERMHALIDEWRTRNSQERFVQLQRRAFDFNQITGSHPLLIETLQQAKKVIENTSLTVLITGETGTGKELLARAVHYNSKNSHSPFVDIACSALPETLLESELFGFEKGAFTDAREKKLGLFELAEDGSIFLDEIGDISLAMQSKLLKVIESRMMRRLGGLQDIPVRARIIAATSVDLDAKMKSGHFRKDLYHRLKIIPLRIPPLRERKEDIPQLVNTFLELFNKVYNKEISGIATDALELLMNNEWEGNIRELKHSIERAVLLEEDSELGRKNFEFLPGAETDLPRIPKERSIDLSGNRRERQINLSVSLEEASIEEIQRKVALKVLDVVKGNKSKAAYILRISRPRLDRILKNVDE